MPTLSRCRLVTALAAVAIAADTVAAAADVPRDETPGGLAAEAGRSPPATTTTGSADDESDPLEATTVRPAGLPKDGVADAAPEVEPVLPATVPPAGEAAPSQDQRQLAEAIAWQRAQARLALSVALGLAAQAAAAVTLREAETAAAETRVARSVREERDALTALQSHRRRMRRWAVQAYTGGTLKSVSYALASDRINDVPRSLVLVAGAFGGLGGDLEDREKVLVDAGRRHRDSREALAVAESLLGAARAAAADASVTVAQRRQEVDALDAGQAATLGGIAFPVAAPSHFTDTFGAPRMAGTRFAHAHQGIDIFAATGTPVVAFERGVVRRTGTDLLGGIKLWLVGQSGSRYYYAHLLGFSPTLYEGKVVEAGETLAFVGNTGNAVTTPHHLHFEIHSPGVGPVNPYPVIARIHAAARTGGGLLAAGAGGGPANGAVKPS